jgi:ATP-dependent 26S proteasome regulatory subunit
MINTSDKAQDSLTSFNHEDDDKLNIGVLLNILDGNADQDGLIVVGTASDVSKLDPAIYRDGRLKHIEFGYMNRSDIVKMIEYYYDLELEESIVRLIRNDQKIQSLKIKNLCIKHIDSDISIGDLINKINRL